MKIYFRCFCVLPELDFEPAFSRQVQLVYLPIVIGTATRAFPLLENGSQQLTISPESTKY